MEEKRPSPVLLGPIAAVLSVLMLMNVGCRTSEPTKATTGLESIQQRLSDPTKDFGAKIGHIAYWQDSGGIYETRKIDLYDDGLQCIWSIEPQSVAPIAQIHFEPGTAQIQRIDIGGRDCLENDDCALNDDYTYDVHGYAWPFEVEDDDEAEALSKIRARKIAEWFSDDPGAEVSAVNWHGTSMTNDERHVTPVEPMGGAIIDDEYDSPRHVRMTGSSLSEVQLRDLVQFLESVAMYRGSALPVDFEGPYDSTLWVLFEPDWLKHQERALKPYWMQRLAYQIYPEFVDWLEILVMAGCDPAELDLGEFPTKSEALREEDSI